jgi:hypothetical protein
MRLFISTGIFDDKLRQQILSVVPTANAPFTGNIDRTIIQIFIHIDEKKV